MRAASINTNAITTKVSADLVAMNPFLAAMNPFLFPAEIDASAMSGWARAPGPLLIRGWRRGWL
jgi:hypothetical protein